MDTTSMTPDIQRSVTTEVHMQSEAQVLEECPLEQRGRTLFELGKAYRKHYSLSRNQHFLDRSISLLTESFELHPLDDPNRSGCANTLAEALCVQYELISEPAVRVEAAGRIIKLLSEVSALFEKDRLNRPWSLINLTYAYLRRWNITRENNFDLDMAISIPSQALELYPSGHNSHGPLLVCYMDALRGQYLLSGAMEDLTKALQLCSKVLEHYPPGHLHRRRILRHCVDALQLQFQAFGTKGTIDKVVALQTELLSLFEEDTGSVEREAVLERLATALWERYNISGETDDLDGLIHLRSMVLASHPPGHSDRSSSIESYALSIGARYDRTGNRDDLRMMISLFSEALDLCPPGHQQRWRRLVSYASALERRYGLQGNLADLETTSQLLSEALDGCPMDHPDRVLTLSNYAAALQHRYNILGTQTQLDVIIGLRLEALELCPPDHSQRHLFLSNYATAVGYRYTLTGDRDDEKVSLKHHAEAIRFVPPGHPERARILINHSIMLTSHYDHSTGTAKDLDTTIAITSEALALCPVGHPLRRLTLGNHGNTLIERFRISGNSEDLTAMIQLLSEAVELSPPGHPERHAMLQSYATALGCRHKVQGNLEDLHLMTQLLSESLELCPPGHPDRVVGLMNYAGALYNRFGYTNDPEDLETTIQLCSKAMELHSPSSPRRGKTLINYASALLYRYDINSARGDIDLAIRLLSSDATERWQTPNDADLWMYLATYAAALRKRYSAFKSPEDLLKALELLKQILGVRSQNDPHYGLSLSNYAHTLLEYHAYARTSGTLGSKELDDILTEVVTRNRECSALYPLGHPEHSRMCFSLATSLILYHQPGRDAEEIVEILKCGATCRLSPFRHSLLCTVAWVDYSRSNHQASLGDAYTHSIQFLRLFLTVGPTAKHQYRALERAPYEVLGLPIDAASHAVQQGNVDLAVEMLDEGRSLLWSELRRFRTPIDEMPRHLMGDELLKEFASTCAQLQTLSTADVLHGLEQIPGAGELTESLPTTAAIRYDTILPQKQKLLERYNTLLVKIRAKSGLEDFQRPFSFQRLQQAAAEGPVIVVNCSIYGSHAIVVFDDKSPVIIHLDNFGDPTEFHEAASKLSADFAEARRNMDENTSGDRSKELGRKLFPILRQLWARVAEPVVAALDAAKCRRGSRVWWCPTSKFLTALPFHAAGTGKRFFMDSYVSSYTTTLQALIHARRHVTIEPVTTSPRLATELARDIQEFRAGGVRKHPKILVVAQTEATGEQFRTLHSLQEEQCALESLGPFVKCLQGKDATKQLVVDHLVSHTWAHFMCHAKLDKNPFNSSLHLFSGSTLSLDDIMKAHLPDAQFAFLAACHSAEQSSSSLQDEVFHLAAAMQFSGFRSVVGTMWAMKDDDGPDVARIFYAKMLQDDVSRASAARVGRLILKLLGFSRFTKTKPDKNGGESYKRAADAISEVSRSMRRNGLEIERWINFVHIGA